MKQQQCSRDVGAVGESYRDRGDLAQLVPLPSPGQKLGQLPSAKSQILQVEDPLREASEKSRHPILEHLTPRAQERRPRGKSLAQGDQIVFVASGSMKQ